MVGAELLIDPMRSSCKSLLLSKNETIFRNINTFDVSLFLARANFTEIYLHCGR